MGARKVACQMAAVRSGVFLGKTGMRLRSLFRVPIFALVTAAAFEGLTPSLGQAQETIGGGRATLVHPGQGGSPHVKVDWVIAGANISIIYGRPYLKDRVVGESVEPRRGRVWRLGADEATTLITDTDLRIGNTQVAAGEYTLWLLDTGDT